MKTSMCPGLVSTSLEGFPNGVVSCKVNADWLDGTEGVGNLASQETAKPPRLSLSPGFPTKI